jgi:hypothetical protein
MLQEKLENHTPQHGETLRRKMRRKKTKPAPQMKSFFGGSLKGKTIAMWGN